MLDTNWAAVAPLNPASRGRCDIVGESPSLRREIFARGKEVVGGVLRRDLRPGLGWHLFPGIGFAREFSSRIAVCPNHVIGGQAGDVGRDRKLNPNNLQIVTTALPEGSRFGLVVSLGWHLNFQQRSIRPNFNAADRVTRRDAVLQRTTINRTDGSAVFLACPEG
ncbi:MAG TPA: hypothetical protein VGS22_15280 [Thermoanaerobaculia bacterium]|nr:hypothetical protein [Thermoanaerobaculia bacterium]